MSEAWREQLSRRIADGEEIDWASLAAERPDEREFLQALRLIERLSAAQRQAAEADGTAARSGEPTRWGHLEIIDRLGEGSFGQVFLARDPNLDREVALKLFDRPSREEGRLLAQIRHPNVVAVFGSAEHDGRAGLWMELVKGRNLAEIVETDGPLQATEAALIGIEVCRALAAVHGAGILHGDIKAQNVMRELGGRIVLTDFGIGQRMIDASERQDLSGTPAYLAPEVLAGEPATPRAEVYSLGVLLFFLVTGSLPVEADSFGELVAKHATGDRKLLSDLRPELPDDFVEIVQRALATDPRRRFATIGRLEEALSALLRRWVDVRRPVSRARSKGFWVAALLAATVLVATGWILSPWFRSTTESRRTGVDTVGTCVSLPSNAVGWWAGEGDAADKVGPNDGTPEMAVTFPTGLVGRAFDFSVGLVRIPYAESLDLQEFTIEAWVRPRSVGDAADSYGPIIVARDLRRRYPTISFTLTGPGTNGNFRASVGLTDGTDPAVTSSQSFPFNEFHHVAMTWSGSMLRLYVNGEVEGELDLGPKTVAYEPTDVGIGAHPLLPGRHFDGLIDEVGLYRRVLSAGEIQAIHAAGSGGKCRTSSMELMGG